LTRAFGERTDGLDRAAFAEVAEWLKARREQPGGLWWSSSRRRNRILLRRL